MFHDDAFSCDFSAKLLRARITIKPTLAGNKRQAIKARVHVNIYLRENNNNSEANPLFGPPLCRGKKVREREGGKGC